MAIIGPQRVLANSEMVRVPCREPFQFHAFPLFFGPWYLGKPARPFDMEVEMNRILRLGTRIWLRPEITDVPITSTVSTSPVDRPVR
ncbi:hypothetical protein SAMN05216266_108250 [Amycolatopsis marina]|uniref:Uncharacterized protein n=1 Tax=Amycolatopsis marina TaxID=490629 RepID=A0A1I1A798_9PSEU|nr:hypothetical protein [Amycolatopsis marina]SFB33831.1 hypothetical protein SAMN05216266_108250 [Amycolatopsis marina]